MIEKRNGTIRNDRWDKALLDNKFQIDQRSFSEIMGYLSSYLEQINYYNSDNEIQGKWGKLIMQDPILFMASIINEPTTKLDQLMIGSREITHSVYNNPETINSLLKWYDKIEGWSDQLIRHEEEKLAYKINNVLDEVLNPQKEGLKDLYNQLIQQKVSQVLSAVSFFSVPPKIVKKIENRVDLKRTAHIFKKVITHIQDVTKEHMDKTFFTRDDHMPHTALYIAFGQLFARVQEQLNGLSQAHLDFYYKEILQQSTKKPQATRTTINFDLLPIADTTIIEKGTRLSAGKIFGSKEDIIFKTNKALTAFNIRLVELETLFFNSSPYIQIGTNNPLISSVSKNKLITLGKDATPTRDDWFVFGANKESLQNTRIEEDKIATIGFMIGSPVLILREGRREIVITVQLEPISAEKIFWPLLKQIQQERNFALNTVVSMIFDDGFIISYTNKKGWIPVENYSVSYTENPTSFAIHLLLENTDPALETSKSIEEKLQWPSIKLTLNPYAPIYLYSFLNGVEIDSITIDVDVQRMKHLSVYNNLGKVALGKPFEIFGPFPKPGSYLLLGESELFKKDVHTVDIKLEWESLPSDIGGFDTYYSDYSETISNDSFLVQSNILSNDFWLPLDPKDAIKSGLFKTTNCLTSEGYEGIRLDSTTAIRIENFNELGISIDQTLKEPLEYSLSTQSGYIKLALVGPDSGFGFDIFQKDIAEITAYNAKHKKNLPFPNKPFIPKVSGVSLSYQASDVITVNIEDIHKNKGELIHIRPFWLDPVISGQTIIKDKNPFLLPCYSAQGYLVFGLKGVKESCSVSIFFHFLRSGSTNEINDYSLTWEYGKDNMWVPFKNEENLNDGTNGLTKSGIIDLILPTINRDENSSVDAEELYWIRVSRKGEAQHYPKIKGIYINAVQATCISDNHDVLGRNLEPGSIKTLVTKNPNVKKVNQPGASFSGSSEETKEAFYGRISERLRHKSRAVSFWDYERLILEKYDTVKVVKCTNLNKKFHPTSGKVKVVVLNSNWTNDERYYFKNSTLQNMRDYLKKHASPFIDIKVVNPTVEYLLVNCEVSFKDKNSAGSYFLKQLNEDIINFLSPVSCISNGMGGIGGRITPRMITVFIGNLSYIKRVKNVLVEHIIRKKTKSKSYSFSFGTFKDDEEISATMPWSILSPVPKHRLVILAGKQRDKMKNIGISTMNIGSDFIIQQRAPRSNKSSAESPKQGVLENNAVFAVKNKS
jgi:hypothetical protein